MTGLPSRSLPSAIGSAARAVWKSRRSISSRNDDHLGDRVRHLDAHRAASRNRRDDADAIAARIASARSFERFANWRTFTPGAGSISNCVTTGPGRAADELAVDRNVRSASMSFTPMASSSRLLSVGVARRRRA